MSAKTYNSEFFSERSEEITIAKTVLSLVFEIFRPESVVDLGTAAGSWLAAAKELGVTQVRGVDGDWVPKEQRHISKEEFVSADIERSIPDLGRFDLAICTEVLEHVSGPASARAVEWLCKSAPVVLFSAAIPLQGGTHHINEAWQSHWARLFKANGYETFDAIRPKIWADDSLPYWYRQNTLLMATAETGRRLGLSPTLPDMLDCVHPSLYLHRSKRMMRLDFRSLNGRFRAFRRLFTV